MPTDFTVIDLAGIGADYRLDADGPLAPGELEALLQREGITVHAAPEQVRTGDVVGRVVPATPVAAQGIELHVICGPDAGSSLVLAEGTTTVGRNPDCSLVLTDPCTSRRHLELDVSARRIVVKPLGNPPATARVDGRQFTAATTIAAGARIGLGNSVLRLVDVTREAEQVDMAPTTPTTIELPIAPRFRHPPLGLTAALVSGLAGAVGAVIIHSIQLLVMATLAPVGFVAASLASRTRGARSHRHATRRHQQALTAGRDRVARACADEAEQLHRDFPDVIALRMRDRPAGEVPDLRVRLGLGPRPARVEVRQSGRPAESPVLSDVPIVADLRDGVLAFCGPLALARAQARWALCQLTRQHGLTIALEIGKDAEPHWAWARWLPNVAITQTTPGSPTPESPAQGPGISTQITVVDCPRADTRRLSGLALVVTGSPRIRAYACQATVPVDDTGVRQVLARPDSDPLAFTADLVSVEIAEQWARRCAVLPPPRSKSALPARARLLDVLDHDCRPRESPGGTAASRLASLDPVRLTSRWQRDPSRVRTPIGLDGHGVISIDLDADGPHALIAGTTGSGKSELLQTLVLGLAARYRPEAVQFLLVDYKGGAAFGNCAQLPHVAGVVTDLDATATSRALRSLRAELRRRELALLAARVSDFHAFHRNATGVLPRLVVVIDEFASLAGELPDFVAGLIQIARRGRSLGMHLVLATQRPAGVVSPEIRANANLRIALRTVTAAESLDVIDSPDAAELDPATPGRAIRAGQPLRRFQVAAVSTTSAPRAPRGATLTRLGPWRQPLEPENDLDDPQAATDGELLVSAVITSARHVGAVSPPAPWLPPLPDVLALAPQPAGSGARLDVGLLDLPDEQRQEMLTLDLGAGGAFAIAGGPRSGRSSALLTVASRACALLRPDELHVHGVDFSGGIEALRDLPHLGTMITARDPGALLSTLVVHLEAEIERRRRLPGNALDCEPRLLVVFDDLPAAETAADLHDLGVTTERVHAVLARCRGSGITVVATGARAVVQGRLSSVLDEGYVLAFADRGEYPIVGLAPASVPEVMPPGRALRLSDDAEVQFGCPVSLAPAERTQQAAIPGRIELVTLPASLPPGGWPRRAGHICLGLGGDASEPVWLNVERHVRLVVAGRRQSGRTAVLCGLLVQAVADGRIVTVVAPRHSPLRAAALHLGQTVADQPSDLGARDLLLVDDADDLDCSQERSIGAAVATALADPRIAVVAAARTDALLAGFRGVTGALLPARYGIVLQPGPVDAELLGQRLNRADLGGPVGRGIAVGDPAWAWPAPLAHPQWLSIQTWPAR